MSRDISQVRRARLSGQCAHALPRSKCRLCGPAVEDVVVNHSPSPQTKSNPWIVYTDGVSIDQGPFFVGKKKEGDWY
jgi:hypothetical protein